LSAHPGHHDMPSHATKIDGPADPPVTATNSVLFEPFSFESAIWCPKCTCIGWLWSEASASRHVRDDTLPVAFEGSFAGKRAIGHRLETDPQHDAYHLHLKRGGAGRIR
jgi:hypothetical protein